MVWYHDAFRISGYKEKENLRLEYERDQLNKEIVKLLGLIVSLEILIPRDEFWN